jgi:hypothetical protein
MSQKTLDGKTIKDTTPDKEKIKELREQIKTLKKDHAQQLADLREQIKTLKSQQKYKTDSLDQTIAGLKGDASILLGFKQRLEALAAKYVPEEELTALYNTYHECFVEEEDPSIYPGCTAKRVFPKEEKKDGSH